jgi:putative transposase
MKEYSASFPVTIMSKVLSVSSSGFYAWLKRHVSPRSLRKEMLGRAVEVAHRESARVYGYRKVHKDVAAQQPCCEETVRKLMRELGLRARHKRKFTVTTDSKHTMPVAPNILDRQFEPELPNQKWVADITYIGTRTGWVYLAAVMDLCGRRIVGWATSNSINTQLVSDALDRALLSRRPAANLLHHSDQGCQYASKAYRQALELQGIECSMSRRGNCWDNACMERFFRSLKTEWLADTLYEDRKQATQAVFEYIESFYNTTRRHAALGYMTPVQFEAWAIEERGEMAA